MNIFNSLGSNYDGPFIWRSLLLPGSRHAIAQLKINLSDHYHGTVALTYKGRQALELALRSSGLPAGSTVGINGLTCYVVYQAVEKAGYRPVFIDVSHESLDFGIDELQTAHKRDPQLRAIIVQNTLGFPTDMPAFEIFCKKHNILIIEDLAHSFGATYSDGREAGTAGDFTMLSFSQDKPLDVVAGGAVVDRRPQPMTLEQPKRHVSLWQREINAMFPLWSAIIRSTYPIGLGRYIHFGLRKLHLLATPMSDNVQGLFAMEPSAARFLLRRWNEGNQDLKHRQTIAKIYQKELSPDMQFEPLPKSRPTYLRFPLRVKDRPSLVAYLKVRGSYIGDTWYDAPIAPRRYLERTVYKTGECPRAEALAEHIVNLPTHRHVSEAVARIIAREVNAWQKLQ